MAKYTLISSRGALESTGAAHYHRLAEELKGEGNDVTLFLVQNGVLEARTSPASRKLSRLAEAGVDVLADRFSLRERGIAEGRLGEGIRPAELDIVVDHLAEGRKVIWH